RVEPQGDEELHQPGHDVTSRQARGELDHDPCADDPEVRPDGVRRELGIRPVPPGAFELGDLPRAQGQTGQAYAEFMERVARDPEYRVQSEHAVEECLLHVSSGSQIGMMQEYVPVGPYEARPDVIDVEERFPDRHGEALLIFPLPMQVVMARACQRG